MERYEYSDMKDSFAAVIAVLIIVGLSMSIYLSLAHYGIVGPGSEDTCSLKQGHCSAAIDSPQSQVLGIPNSIAGVAYFSLLAGAVALRLIIGRWVAPWLLLGIFTVGLAMSIYYVYLMYAVLQAPCPYCLTAHAANIGAFAIYTLTFTR